MTGLYAFQKDRSAFHTISIAHKSISVTVTQENNTPLLSHFTRCLIIQIPGIPNTHQPVFRAPYDHDRPSLARDGGASTHASSSRTHLTTQPSEFLLAVPASDDFREPLDDGR